MYRPSVALKYLDSYLGKCLIVNPRYTIRLTCLLATTGSSAHLLAETSLNGLFAGEWDSKTLKHRDFGPPQAKNTGILVILFPKNGYFDHVSN